MTEKDTLWNKFIEDICDRDAETLTALRNSYGKTGMLFLTENL